METNLINIIPYPKPKKDGGGGSSNITFNINTSDIGGDLNVKSLNANRVMAEYVEANNLEATNGKFVYLVASDGTISTLRGNNLTYDTANIGDLTANNIETQKLNVTDTATIENIFNTYLNSKEIVTDYLTVNKSAHFFEVIIDKIKSVGGTIINTATSCILDYVIPYNADGETTFDDPGIVKYRCYWKRYANENSQDKKDEVQNDWWVYDQAISQNCHLVSGVNHDVGNHYYWRLVTDVSGENPVYVNFDTGQVWNEEGIPEYQIKFSGHEAETEEDVTINAGFTYDNGETNTEDQPDAQLIITDWNITPVSGIETDWDETEKIFTVRDTINGLQIMPKPVGTNDIVQAPYISKGTFSFATEYPTKLNVFVFYDDETVEYHPAPEIATNIYQIELASITNTVATRFVITSAEVNVWHLCNWIDLSNTDKDAPTHLTGTFDDAPRAGDNVCQLGYRYNEYNEGDEEYVPSRASAIIIASFVTPDSGGTVNGKRIKPIVPPSYAQYQNITNYKLYTHRGTYMDATGGYFKGNLVSESGDIINIGNDLTVDTEYYQLISNENPITRPSSGTKPITFRILYVHNGEGTMLSSLPTDWYTKTSLDNYTDEDDLTVNIGASTSSLEVRLYDDNDNLKDTYVATTINLSDVTNGIDGAYNQWAYRNAASNPGFPEENSQDNTWSTAGYPPNNWSENPTTPSTGQHTWMTTRTCTPVSQTQTEYGGWSYPIRITGDDGQPGTDGTTTEFIYKHFTDEQTWSSTDSANPANWSAQQEADYLGPTEYEWSDNPQGVSSSYLYEYVSTRSSYIQNGNTYWNTFTTPALWAKFGEKGMDGDGYEYIFKAFGNEQTFKQNNNNPAYWNANQNDDYTGPSGHAWSDDPVTLDSTTNKIEYVAVRKKEDGIWSKFSTPEIWAMYGGTGPQGGTGPSGPQGEDGTNDKLIPIYQFWEVRTESTSDYNDIISKLYTNLKFKVFHIEGETVTEQQRLPDAGYKISATVYANSGATLKAYYYNSSTSYLSMTCTSEDGGSLNRFNLSFANMLSDIYSDTSKQDYRKLSQSNTVNTQLPVRMIVQLTLNGTVVDQKEYEVTFKAGHIFEVTDAALNSAFFGNWKDSQGNTVNGMSSIRQDMTGIQTNVSALSTSLNGLQSDYSTFKQSAKGFQTKVESDYYDGNGDPTITTSIIDQRAGSISAGVQTDIEGRLNWTGINIQGATSSNPGTITLNANNTIINGDLDLRGNFVSENTNQMNKITIDSYNGGFKMYGPSGTQGGGNPASGATSRQLMEIGWTEDENFKRFGEVIVNKKNISNPRPTDSNEITLNDQGVFINKNNNELLLSSEEFSFKEYSGNTNNSSTTQQINYSWPRVAGFKNVVVLQEPTNTNELRIAADRDVYMCAAKLPDETVLNWNNVTFEMGIVSGQTAITQGMYPGRVITLRLIAGMKLHCNDSKIVMKNEAWYGGGAYTVNITSTNSYTFVNYNGSSWIEI